jgi:hypothetical protein
MSRFYSSLSVLLAGFLSLTTSLCAHAQEATVVQVQEQPMIITTVPAPKEQIVVPQGYISCFVVAAGWSYNNTWAPEHKVCQYAPNNGTAVQGVAWVDSYWACTQYKSSDRPKEGECTKWEWQPGHWVKTLEVY